MEPSEHEKERIERLRRVMYSRKLAERIPERERHELEQSRNIVGDDWHAPEPELSGVTVAPAYIGYARNALRWVLALSVLFFIGATGFFGFYFLAGSVGHATTPSNIEILVSGPPQVAGGEPAELQIIVVNKNNTALDLADLVISFPPGTRSVTDFATDLPSLRQSLGTIEPSGRRQGTVSAVFSGAAGQDSKVKVELEYRIHGSNAIFVASQDYDLKFTSSPLSISVDGNTQTTSGQPVQFTITIASNASTPIKDVLLDIGYPFGFKYSTASPPPGKNGLWSLGDFLPGQRKSVLVQGTLAGEQGDRRIFRLAAGTRSATSSVITAKLADNTYEMQISQPFLGLAMHSNISKTQDAEPFPAPLVFTATSSGKSVAAPGEVVTITIAYQNNLTTEITDAVIVARLTGIPVDGETVRTNEGFYRSTDETVLWDKVTTSGVLGSLAPGARGTVSFSFTMPTGDPYKKVNDPKIDINVNAAGKRLSEAGVPQNLQSTARQQIKLASDLNISTQALYAANPFGVTGPLPPKAGAETNYALVFTVTNSTNKVTRGKVTATLPPYVRWIGSHAPSTEKLTFNQFDGTFTWDLGDIAPGVGQNGTQPRQLAISVGFTPSTSQIGEQPELVRNVVLVGTDSSTGSEIKKFAEPNVSTNLNRIGKSASESSVGTDPGFSPADATVVK